LGRSSRGTRVGTSAWARRQVERPDCGTGGRQRVDRPQDLEPAEGELREQERDAAGKRVRDQQDASTVHRISDHAADHRKRDNREDAYQADEPERERLPLGRHQQRHVPEQRRVLHHRSGEREQQPNPQQPEVPMLQCGD
jgi:hypothetical protein